MRSFTDAELRVLSRLHALEKKQNCVTLTTFSRMLKKLAEDITKWYNLQDKRTIPIYINRELVCEMYLTNRLTSLHLESPYISPYTFDKKIRIKDCIEVVNILHVLLEIPWSKE